MLADGTVVSNSNSAHDVNISISSVDCTYKKTRMNEDDTVYRVLYTKDINKKRKVYSDGTLHVRNKTVTGVLTSTLILFDCGGQDVRRVNVPTASLTRHYEPGDELAIINGYHIQIEQHEGPSGQGTQRAGSCNTNPRDSSSSLVTGGAQVSGLNRQPSSSLFPQNREQSLGNTDDASNNAVEGKEQLLSTSSNLKYVKNALKRPFESINTASQRPSGIIPCKQPVKALISTKPSIPTINSLKPIQSAPAASKLSGVVNQTVIHHSRIAIGNSESQRYFQKPLKSIDRSQIQLDPSLAKLMKDHQVVGANFLMDSLFSPVESYEDDLDADRDHNRPKVRGAILADEVYNLCMKSRNYLFFPHPLIVLFAVFHLVSRRWV